MSKESDFEIMSFLPYLLNQAAEQTSREFQAQYRKQYNMLRTEWRVLFHLGWFGTMTANDVVRAARIHKTKISRAVTALETKGFLKRARNPADRRSEQLSLTARGKAVYETLSAAAETYEKSLIKDLSNAEVEMLKRVLKRIKERARVPAV